MARGSLLERLEAVALLEDAEVSAAALRDCQDLLQRYLRRFYREEQSDWAEVVIQGKRGSTSWSRTVSAYGIGDWSGALTRQARRARLLGRGGFPRELAGIAQREPGHPACRISASFCRRDRALTAASRLSARLRLAWRSW